MADNQGSFFLDPDDAKTFGDIDYMRTSKTVKRTFPKGKGPARVRSISAMKEEAGNATSMTGSSSSTTSSWGTPGGTWGNPVTPKAPEASQPSVEKNESAFAPPEEKTKSSNQSSPDNSMDMFRNMAKEIRKR
ncbi:MAG: hypothetical protein AAGA75_09360 [Cyanobacteria bacterium P01_E01_bin.6]